MTKVKFYGTEVAFNTATKIIEKFEDFLNEKGIIIPNSEKDEDDSASNIYGSDYDKLENEIIEIIKG